MTSNYFGLDVGTDQIVLATNIGTVNPFVQNVFVSVPAEQGVKKALQKLECQYFWDQDFIQIVGEDAYEFSTVLNRPVRRTMKAGTVVAGDDTCIRVFRHLLSEVLKKHVTAESFVCFSVPSSGFAGAPTPSPVHLQFHENLIRDVLKDRKCTCVPVKEGMAVVYSELQEEGYTGIGISFGAGLVNVVLSYMTMVAFDFSLPLGGDVLDERAAALLGVNQSRIREAKENGFSFNARGGTLYETLRLVYADMMATVISAIRQSVERMKLSQRFNRSIPIAIAGGACLPEGFSELLAEVVGKTELPFRISGVRRAANPLRAVSAGCLRCALESRVQTPAELVEYAKTGS
jgi:hypothetical protein